MKKKFFLMSLMASLFMVGCTQEDIVPGEEGNTGDGAGETKYMAVTISTSTPGVPMMAKSRAEGDEEKLPDYEHGLTNESEIKTLDFYFFDADGKPANVKSDGTNHVEAKIDIKTIHENENITKTLQAVLVISTKDGDAIPEQIVAILNKGNDNLYAGKTIAELQEEATDGIVDITTESNTESAFVMTNSVYVSGNVLQIGAHIAGHLCQSEEAALEKPVTVYVERTLAKVQLTSSITSAITLNDGTVLYDTQDDKGYTEPVEGEDENEEGETKDGKIYVKFLGWNTTATSTENRLVKKIDRTWKNSPWIWYTADYHRSFWAINAKNNGYSYFRFEPKKDLDTTDEEDVAINAEPANKLTAFDGTAYSYVKENAAASDAIKNPTNPTQVIIAAQLVDKDGNPVEFAEWAFQRMTVDGLKKAFANAATLYRKESVTSTITGEDGTETTTTTTILKKITPEEIVLKTATAAGYTDINGDRRYLVYGALTEEAAQKEWYKESRTDATEISAKEISDIFYGLGGAKVWTEGKTYYYFTIRHLAYGTNGAEFGQRGVVRNHVYKTGVKSLTGLGTPVYDPEEKIIPEKPDDDDTYIAAEIKVLSWHIVNSNYDLEW